MKTLQIIGIIFAIFNCAMALAKNNYSAALGWFTAFCFALALFLKGNK